MAPTEMISHGILVPYQLPVTPPYSPRPSTPEQDKVSSQAKSLRLLQSAQAPTKIFSRYASSMEEGRRLENLSWRLWNTDTFCCNPVLEDKTTTPSTFISARSSEGLYSAEPPSLSGSLDSLVDEEALEFDSDNTPTSVSAPADTSHSRIQRQDSVLSRSHGRERQIIPDDLEKMIITIKEKKDLKPLSPRDQSHLATLVKGSTKPSSLTQTPTPADNSKPMTSDNSSDLSAWPVPSDSTHGNTSRTIVVRGFLPYTFSYLSKPLLTSPSSNSMGDITAASSENGQMLAVGGASGDNSTSEQTDLIWNSLQHSARQLKKPEARLNFGNSSDEDENSLPQTRSALVDPTQQPLKKQTFLKEDPITVKKEQAFGGDVFETEEGEIDESAVDDDDDPSQWEDLVEDSRDPSIDEKTFQRVDPRSNLTPSQSLITLLLQDQPRNAITLANAAAAIKSAPAIQRSVKSTPNGPSLAVSPKSEDNLPLMMKDGLSSDSEVPRSQSQPINPIQGLALSPRSTRRNMLASEMTVSLRQHLLWERKQTTQSDIAITKHRRAAYDVANSKQIPEKVYMDQSDGDRQNWNDYYGRDLGGYHSRGW